MDNLLNTPLH